MTSRSIRCRSAGSSVRNFDTLARSSSTITSVRSGPKSALISASSRSDQVSSSIVPRENMPRSAEPSDHDAAMRFSLNVSRHTDGMSTLERSEDGLTVLRPTPASRRRVTILSIVVLVPSMLSLLISARQQPWLIVLAVALIGVAIWLTVAFLKVFRFEYGGGRYRLVTLFRRKDFAVANIRAVHTFDAFRQGVYTSKELLVEGTDGRRLARLNGQLWDVGLLTVAAQDMAANGASADPDRRAGDGRAGAGCAPTAGHLLRGESDPRGSAGGRRRSAADDHRARDHVRRTVCGGDVTFAFIRHGQTDWNRDDRLQGSSDIPLNDAGRAQAHEAAELLRDGGWQVVVSSPLVRARETAADHRRRPRHRARAELPDAHRA